MRKKTQTLVKRSHCKMKMKFSAVHLYQQKKPEKEDDQISGINNKSNKNRSKDTHGNIRNRNIKIETSKIETSKIEILKMETSKMETSKMETTKMEETKMIKRNMWGYQNRTDESKGSGWI